MSIDLRRAAAVVIALVASISVAAGVMAYATTAEPGTSPTTEVSLPPAPAAPRQAGTLHKVNKESCTFFITVTVDGDILGIYVNEPDKDKRDGGAAVGAITMSIDPRKPTGTADPMDPQVPWRTLPNGNPITVDRAKGHGVADGMQYWDFSGSKDGNGDFVPFDVTVSLSISGMCLEDGDAVSKSFTVNFGFKVWKDGYLVGPFN